jgi:M6 family metalloprotease-like protein
MVLNTIFELMILIIVKLIAMTRTLRLCLFSLLLIFFSDAYSVPALSTWKVFTNADGSTVTILLTGDENLSYVHDKEGYTLLYLNGSYYYAIHDADGNLVASDIVARDGYNKSAALGGVNRGLTYSEAQLGQRQVKRLGGNRDSQLKSSGIQSSTFPPTGKRKLLMILVNFVDKTPTYTQEDFNRYMNEENYGGIGSFRDFYLENSYGKLDITTTVTRWVTLSRAHSFYGRDNDKNAYQVVIEAIDQLDDEIDFSEFDNDGDGIVDGLAIIHQGQGEEFTGSDPDNIWSHSWALSSALYPQNPPKKDGVYINSYTIQPEIMAGRKNTKISTIGVMCHEFGHNLGAPDYYDTDGKNNGTGQWDIMAAGSWNGTSGNRPAHFTAYQKEEFGWLELKTVTESADVELKPLSLYPDAYKIPTTTEGEFFVLENRQKNTGFETGLPGKGMIVYHVDQNHINKYYPSNKVNVGTHQGIYPIVASGNMSNPNTDGCPFPGTGNKTQFTDFSSPSSLSWNGALTIRPVTGITESGSNILFSLGVSNPDPVTPVNMTVEYLGLAKVKLKWEKGENTVFGKYNVYRDGVLIASAVEALECIDDKARAGLNKYAVSNVATSGGLESEALEVTVLCDVEESFKAINVVTNLSGKIVNLNWSNTIAMHDGFESVTPFALNSSGTNNWSYIDGDILETHSFGGVYDNMAVAKSFVGFNPGKVESVDDYELVEPIEGEQYMVSFAPKQGVADDWLVSKELNLNVAHKLVFHARSEKSGYAGQYVDLINVGVSTSGSSKADFTFINGQNAIELNERWTRYEILIPAGSKYFAIHCASENGFATLIDDLSLRVVSQSSDIVATAADVYPPSEVTGYNVYRDNALISSNLTTPSISDEIQIRGSYEYVIETLVGSSKLPVTSVKVPVLVKETAIAPVEEVQKDVIIYPNPASDIFNVKCAGHTVKSVTVFSMTGKNVRSVDNSESVSISGLPSGYYVVKITTDKGVFVKRVQKR